MHNKPLKECSIVIKGAGEMATGVACSLYRAILRKILLLEIPSPLAVRRAVSFCEAVHDASMKVEGIEAVLISGIDGIDTVWNEGNIPLLIDPNGSSVSKLKPDVFVDATIAKRNLGVSISDARLVIALG
ncbi:MAG: molybdenum hydroxylase, partial [Deltaproteobacteria bacterium]